MAIALSVLLLLQAAPATDREPPTIVIQARRAEEDLAACLARNCPPDQEIEAALDAAVQQFADGRYLDAKRNLTRTISRNREHASEHPQLFGSLLATTATVADHEGDDALYRRTTFQRGRFVREAFGETNIESISADLQTGDMLAADRAYSGAASYYRRAQRAAEQSGRQRLVAAAIFREAWLAVARRRFSNAEAIATRALAVAGSDRLIVELTNILRLRIAFAKNDDEAVARLLAAFPATSRRAPVLITAPRMQSVGPSLDDRAPRGGVEFADIGFWVRPDGSAAEVEVLRLDGSAARFNPVIRHIDGRRYAPFQAEDGDPGIYQIERFTLRQSIGVATGSLIRGRVGNHELRVASLTHMAENQPQTSNDLVQ